MGETIERHSGIALWRQIADRIRSDIVSGRFGRDGRLPPELALAERFGVNRHTVRSAIAALTAEGVLRAEQGRGTFVSDERKLTYRIGERTRFSESLSSQARELGGLLVAHAVEEAHAEVAAGLEVPAGTALIRLETLGTADGRPVSRATNWFVGDRVPGMVDAYRQTGSVTAALALNGVPDYFRKSTVVSARHADTEDLERLKLAPGAIVLVTTAVNVDDAGCPFQYAVTRFAADRVELSIAGRDKAPGET